MVAVVDGRTVHTIPTLNLRRTPIFLGWLAVVRGRKLKNFPGILLIKICYFPNAKLMEKRYCRPEPQRMVSMLSYNHLSPVTSSNMYINADHFLGCLNAY